MNKIKLWHEAAILGVNEAGPRCKHCGQMISFDSAGNAGSECPTRLRKKLNSRDNQWFNACEQYIGWLHPSGMIGYLQSEIAGAENHDSIRALVGEVLLARKEYRKFSEEWRCPECSGSLISKWSPEGSVGMIHECDSCQWWEPQKGENNE
jgi:uncharacterized protein with PIN domain